MQTNQVEIILHVDETLVANDQNAIVNDLQGKPGVSHAHFTPNRAHLMVVDYDPDRIHAADVLGYIREEHVHAELIGGL